jgi:hypothetical protein
MGYFAKQYKSLGMTAPLFTNQWTSGAQAIAGGAYTGVYFLGEYIDPNRPQNGWASILGKTYKARFKKSIETYPAEYYETTFAFWQLARDVLKKGGNINHGPDLLAALEAKPRFPSVFGGNATKAGVLGINLKTHSVATRGLSVTIGRGSGQRQVATYDITGTKRFKLV